MNCYLKAVDEIEGDENVKNWVNDVRDLAFDAEDVIEAYILKRTMRRRMGFIKRNAFVFNDMFLRHKIGTEIKRIRSKIRDISDRRLRYGIKNVITSEMGQTSRSASERLRVRREISPDLGQHDIVGFEEDLNILTTQLIEQSPRRCVISIIAMGGSGKSTLASKLFSLDAVKTHFDTRAWINVSQVYEVKLLLQEIAKEIMELKSEDLIKMSEVELKKKVHEFLKGKRYLLVMIDVWTSDVWESLKVALPDMSNGSRIIITTRNKEITVQVDPVSLPHELKPLSDDDSWNLFTTKVLIAQECTLSTGKYSFPKKLEELGKKIVKKCGGLPLAIVLLGSLLIGKLDDFKAWSKIHWQLDHDKTPCTQILALSYSDLPSYLKPCFLYLRIYPENSKIFARRLIRMWIAEGFIVPRGNKIDEDIAEEYLEELAERCMVQITQRQPTKDIMHCRIHDLLRDLSISKAKEVGFLYKQSNTTSSRPFTATTTRMPRVVFHPTMDDFFVDPSYRHICSAFYFGILDQKILEVFFRNSAAFGMLRVLNLSCNQFLGDKSLYPVLPKALLHLLKLDALSNLHQLRHLHVDGYHFHPPNDLSSSSSNLQSLDGLGISKWSHVKDGWDKYTNLKQLGLRGGLHFHEEDIANWIAKLDKLEDLTLDMFPEKPE
ncbi:hypothetical protein GIB67_007637 [Kingdonia uniflora]|uniref:Uncharacterized protein n=1 Tax=Kingdonia uniflora TaxID=39325 RepID=A0A7J7N1H8_9MAGN|nr:hypothetical protein GIB67_007637 [Kingdonia uniflora]